MKKTLLSIIIPVYNEERYLENLFKKIKKFRLKNINKEIIFINDGSSDNSLSIIKKIIKKEKTVRIINKKNNQGKGEAVKAGIKISQGEIIVIQDADLEYGPENLKKLIKPILEKKAEVVYGKRSFLLKKTNWLIFAQLVANKLINLIFNFLFKTNLNDIETGYKIFQKQVIKKIIKNIQSKDFVWEIEVTFRLIKNQIQIKEIPIDYFPRDYQQGKKINIIDFFKAIFFIFKFYLNL